MKPGWTKEQADFLTATIRKYFPKAAVIAFGSRAGENFSETSDLDLCLKDTAALDRSKWAQLESEIVQSDLPFKVDLVDWHRITEDFRVIILKSTYSHL